MGTYPVPRRVVRAFRNSLPKTPTCYFCRKRIAGNPDIHHVDGDHFHNDLENLAPAHHGCHSSHHAPRDFSEEHRANLSRAKIGNSNAKGHGRPPGFKHSEETIAKMKAKAANRKRIQGRFV